MTTALDLARTTVARATADYVRGGMSYCQQFVGNAWEAHFGRGTPNSYPSARAAQLASGPLNGNPETAPPGAIHYFEYGTLGHVGLALGSGLMASGTGRSAGALMHLGRSVYVHRVATYGLKYLGWSYTNGARPRIEGLTDHQAPVVAANQRQVKANADARRRVEPSTLAAYDANANLKANAVVTPDGFVRSTLAGGQPNGSDVWLKIGATFSHVSGFTNAGTAGLKDLGVIPVPKPKHAVTIVFGPTESKVVEVVEGLTLGQPGDPERDLFEFQGWAVGGVLYDFSRPVSEPFTLEALWSVKANPEPNPGEGQEPTPEPEPEGPGEVDVEPEPTDQDPEKPEPSKPNTQGGVIAAIVAVVLAIGGIIVGIIQAFGV